MSEADASKRLSAILRKQRRRQVLRRRAGCKGDRVLFNKAYGLADKANNIPNKLDTSSISAR
jgi:hypothetical protein